MEKGKKDSKENYRYDFELKLMFVLVVFRLFYALLKWIKGEKLLIFKDQKVLAIMLFY